MERWVQHKSGQGEKWEVIDSGYASISAKFPATGPTSQLILPKSEYVACDPPERWEDVTDRIRVDWSGPR